MTAGLIGRETPLECLTRPGPSTRDKQGAPFPLVLLPSFSRQDLVGPVRHAGSPKAGKFGLALYRASSIETPQLGTPCPKSRCRHAERNFHPCSPNSINRAAAASGQRARSLYVQYHCLVPTSSVAKALCFPWHSRCSALRSILPCWEAGKCPGGKGICSRYRFPSRLVLFTAALLRRADTANQSP